MELADKLRKIMSGRFGICSDEELEKALDEMQGLDLGMFAKTLERKENVA